MILEGKRIVVTRAARQGSDLAERLRAMGAEPMLVPAIETVAPTSYAALDAALNSLNSFDWLLFTSANAVEAMASRMGERRLGGRAKVAAIGPATARALQALGVTPNLVPPVAHAEFLTQSLLPHARQPDGTPTHFLLIRAEEARELIPSDLRAAGADVTIAQAYRTVIPAGSKQLVRQMFGDSDCVAIDAITFTSSSTARNLIALCDAAAVILPQSARRVSIGPITTDTLRELGFPAHAEAREATGASLVEALVGILTSGPSGQRVAPSL